MREMADDDKKKKRGPWDDIFGGFDDDFDEMRRRMDLIMDQFMRGQLSPWQEPMIYGFSMRVGPDGKPRIQEFGNASPKVSNAEMAREPLTDIIEEADKVRVIVELPGVEREDIRLNATENTLDIDVDVEDRKFGKHLDLPCDVNSDSAKASYKNGVLEITLDRLKPKKTGKPVRIE